MTYHLYCAVNAAGVPYPESFRGNERSAICAHVFSKFQYRVDAQLGVVRTPAGEIEERWNECLSHGDRVVRVKIETNETVISEVMA